MDITEADELNEYKSVDQHMNTTAVRSLPSLEQKKLLVEQMWRVAFADAEILAHEEYLVRKVAGLLHLPLADFLEAKIRARDAFR